MASILFVEDEARIRELIGGALVDEGFEVSFAEDGAQAIQALSAATFDVVISDVSMPGGVTGVDVAQHLAAHSPTTRIILVSGHALAQLPDMPAGVQFLPKPYRISQLFGLLPPA